jgi:multidrug resistance efflux pump
VSKKETSPAKPEAKDEQPVATEAPADSTSSEKKVKVKDPVRLVTWIVLTLVLLIFIWQLVADRFTPYTDNARVQGIVVPIVPKVSGYIKEVNIGLHSIIESGDVLFQIDKKDYKIAVRKAEADLDMAAQSIGALTASVKSAASRLGVARATLDGAQRNYDRTQQVVNQDPGALSQADRDLTEIALNQAIANLAAAEAELVKAKEQLGITGSENPQLRAAVVALEKAQMYLAYTTVHAPTRGVIENLNIDIGHYSNAGQPLATFLSMSDAWIVADMLENNIGNIKAGDLAEFTLDLAPGKTFKGEVRSISYGINAGGNANRGALTTVSKSKGWLRERQRFPVIIGIGEDAEHLIRSGGQADVIVYTGENRILNGIGRFQIRANSWLSYVR